MAGFEEAPPYCLMGLGPQRPDIPADASALEHGSRQPSVVELVLADS